jgi:hypothetical protein
VSERNILRLAQKESINYHFICPVKYKEYHVVGERNKDISAWIIPKPPPRKKDLATMAKSLKSLARPGRLERPTCGLLLIVT